MSPVSRHSIGENHRAIFTPLVVYLAPENFYDRAQSMAAEGEREAQFNEFVNLIKWPE
jgi:hypothetical protein